ncbi:MAG: hypothetical protein RLZZ440_2494, partial [Planctomycetota bacterium]
MTAPAETFRRLFVAARATIRAAFLIAVVPQATLAQEPAGIQPLPPVAASEAAAATPSPDTIVEVRIEGNETTDVSKLPKLTTRAGQVFDPQVVEEDVRTLHRSRKFVDVHPKFVRVADGVVVI